MDINKRHVSCSPLTAANCMWLRSSPSQWTLLCVWRQRFQFREELDEVLWRLCQDPRVPCLFFVLPRPLDRFLLSLLWLISSSGLLIEFVSLQEHRDAWTGSSVSDSLVHPYWGRGHPHCSHYVRDHVSQQNSLAVCLQWRCVQYTSK